MRYKLAHACVLCWLFLLRAAALPTLPSAPLVPSRPVTVHSSDTHRPSTITSPEEPHTLSTAHSARKVTDMSFQLPQHEEEPKRNPTSHLSGTLNTFNLATTQVEAQQIHSSTSPKYKVNSPQAQADEGINNIVPYRRGPRTSVISLTPGECLVERAPSLPATFVPEVGSAQLFSEKEYRSIAATVQGCGCINLQSPIIIESFVGSANHSFAFYATRDCQGDPFYQRFREHFDVEPNVLTNSVRIVQGVLDPIPTPIIG